MSKTKQSSSLFYKDGSSDKEYHVQIVEQGDGFIVPFQYGRRGSTLQTGVKTTKPVSEAEAVKIYNKLVKEKTGKGYVEAESKKSEFTEVDVKEAKEVILAPQLLNPIDDVDTYIVDVEFVAQPKKDGERRIIIREGKQIIGLNKKGTKVALPTSVADAIQVDCILDGEIIGEKFFAFDILSLKGKDLKDTQFASRIVMFNYVKFGEAVVVVETAQTTAEKQKMLEKLKAENAEGIVFKRKKSTYVSGRPASGGHHLKHKFYSTATFIVEGTTDGKRSVGLLMVDGDNKKFMGKCTVPPNHEIPKAGALVEVRYLYAYKDGAVYQPTYIGERNDCDLTDCTVSQLVYKAEE